MLRNEEAATVGSSSVGRYDRVLGGWRYECRCAVGVPKPRIQLQQCWHSSNRPHKQPTL
jgi:hypothetical protein